MDTGAYRIAYLIAGYIRESLTEQEQEELNDWVNASDHNMRLFEDLTDENNLEANLAWMEKVKSEESFRALLNKGAFKKHPKWLKLGPAWIAAASIILLTGLFFIYRYARSSKVSADKIALSDSSKLQPGGNHAKLTLGDGSVVDLSTAKNGLIKKEQGSDISKLNDGELIYVAAGATAENFAMNILSTPIGGQYQLKLPDGTKVWLNAATTLRYPTRFSADERRVELEGEAYFEVAKNEKQSFRVILANSASITVLGTHFNVMAYPEETEKEVTLLEGNVAISNGTKIDRLEPGMQASITNAGISKLSGVDTAGVTGWKNGLFVFHEVPIEFIMRQVERWYDAKVVYQGEIKQVFNATILRSEPVTKLLHILELNGYVHFTIENKTIYVLL